MDISALEDAHARLALEPVPSSPFSSRCLRSGLRAASWPLGLSPQPATWASLPSLQLYHLVMPPPPVESLPWLPAALRPKPKLISLLCKALQDLGPSLPSVILFRVSHTSPVTRDTELHRIAG